MKIAIRDIWVTQVGFRNEAQLEGMRQYVRDGGLFSRDAISEYNSSTPGTQNGWPIKLSQFEDGRLFCADGHHRLAAIILGGRRTLDPSEYEIQQWKYSDYMDINFSCNWVTPIDPRTEIRVSDYAEFKKEVAEVLGRSQDEAAAFIRSNKEQYAIPRCFCTIQDILENRRIY